jgi:HSP20 family protein
MKQLKQMAKWDPFDELDSFQRRLANAFGVGVRDSGEKDWLSKGQWTPLVDVAEDSNEYAITVELPGVEKEDVKVTVENGTLLIKGERKFESEEKGKQYHRIERAYGSFVRSFALPENAEPDKVGANFKNGMLKITLPKGEAARPREIQVKVS